MRLREQVQMLVIKVKDLEDAAHGFVETPELVQEDERDINNWIQEAEDILDIILTKLSRRQRPPVTSAKESE